MPLEPVGKRERREKVWWVDSDRLIPIFSGRLEIVGFPADARIVAVTAEFGRRAVGLLVESQEFDVVPDGAFAPDFEGPLRRYVVVAEPAFAITHLDRDPGDFLGAFAAVERHFEGLGEDMPVTPPVDVLPAWQVLKKLLQPVCFYAKDGTERLESPDGKVKFREFM